MEHNSPEEKSLLKAMRKGSLRAFEEILFAYEKEIFRYLFHIVHQRQDAQDLTQETFFKLYEHRKTIDEEKKFKTYLYTIATHAAYDWLRKKRKRRELFILNDENHPFETIDPVSPYYLESARNELAHNLEKREQRAQLQEALKRLKTPYRSAIALFYQEGFTYKEIADTMGVPINTVKTLIRRGREALKKIVNP